MSKRERILTAISRRRPDRIPKDIFPCLSAKHVEEFQQRVGSTIDPYDYYGIGVREMSMGPSPFGNSTEDIRAKFRVYHPDLSPDAEISKWGVGTVWSKVDPRAYQWISPMRNFQSIDEIESYPFPSPPNEEDFVNVQKRVNELHAKGLAAFAEMWAAYFVLGYMLRGYEELMIDFLSNEGFAHRLLGKISEINCIRAEKLSAAGVDIIAFGDGSGSSIGLVMSLKMWRKYLKPYLIKLIHSAKKVNPKIKIFLHSDGNIEGLVPELIEVGVDVVNPVDPDCTNLAQLKRKYGNKIAFWGGMSFRNMRFGKPEDIRREVKDLIETMGKDGGFIISTPELIEDVPWDNIAAFLEAADDYGACYI